MVARRWSSHHDTLQITSPPIGSAAPIQPLAEGGAAVLVERGMVERRRQRLGIMRHIHQPCPKHRAEPAAPTGAAPHQPDEDNQYHCRPLHAADPTVGAGAALRPG